MHHKHWPVVAALRTVFLNNSAELEGDNVEANLVTMLRFAAAVSDGGNHGTGALDVLSDECGEDVADFCAKMSVLCAAEAASCAASAAALQLRDAQSIAGGDPAAAKGPATETRHAQVLSVPSPPPRRERLRSFVSTIKEMYRLLPHSERVRRELPMRHCGLGARPGEALSESATGAIKWKRLRLQQLAKLALVSRLPVAVTSICPHCELRNTLPPLQAVRPVHRFTDTENAVYPNICLGIVSADNAMERLWTILSELYVDSEKLGSNPTLEECVAAACSHMTFRIGVAPWVEHFIVKAREHAAVVQQSLSQCADVQARTRAASDELRALKFRIVTLDKLLSVQNPADERSRCLLQMQQLLRTLAHVRMGRDEVTAAARRMEREIQSTMAAVAIRNEEARRLVACIADLVDAAPTVGAVISGDRVHRMLVGVLGDIARGNTLGRRKQHHRRTDDDVRLCPSCLFPISSTPYCTATGQPHVPPDVARQRRLSRQASLAASAKRGSSDAADGNAAGRSGSQTPAHVGELDLGALQAILLQQRQRRESRVQIGGASGSGEGQSLHHGPSGAAVAGSAGVGSGADASRNKRPALGGGAKLASMRKAVVARASLGPSATPKAIGGAREATTATVAAAALTPRSPASTGLRSQESGLALPPISQRGLAGAGSTAASSPSMRHLQQHRDVTAGAQTGLPFVLSDSHLSASGPSRTPPSHSLRVDERSGAAAVPRRESRGSGNEGDEAFEALQRQFTDFIAAAAAGPKALRRMRELPHRLAHPALTAATRTSLPAGALQQLMEVQEQFHEWFSLMMPQLSWGRHNSSGDGALGAMGGGVVNVLSTKTLEQSVLQLKKELRNCKYAFAKRPKGRSHQGANLDDKSFFILALKIAELERRNQALRTRLKQVVEQRRAVQKRLQALQTNLGADAAAISDAGF